LFLQEIKLINFRCFDELLFKPDKSITILKGDNAQGKTSIIEGVYLCSTGRSHRTSKDKELIFWERDFLSISSLVQKREGNLKISLKIIQGEKKKIDINGISVTRLGELMGSLNCVMFAYDDLKLIKEGPAERRKFVDIALSQVKPKYFYSLQQYIKILNQRNTLLKSIQKDFSLKKTLRVWNEQLSQVASYITLERINFAKKLETLSRSIHSSLSWEKEKLSLTYCPSIQIEKIDFSKINQAYENALIKKEEEDIRKGNTSIGIHRDDLKISINGFDLRAFGSQGQQKSAVLSVKLAELNFMEEETGETPVLLLDDCLSELDIHRQERIFELSKKYQTIITVSDIKGLHETFLRKALVLRVKDAQFVE